MKTKNCAIRSAFWLAAILWLLPAPSAAQGVKFFKNDTDFDSWASQIVPGLKDFSLIPGVAFFLPPAYLRENVCVGTELLEVVASPYDTSPNIFPVPEVSCQQSVDTHGNPLPYAKVITKLPATTQSHAIRAHVAGGQSVGFPLFARDILVFPAFPLASFPSPPACTSANSQSMVVNHGSSSVTIVDSCAGTVIHTIPVVSNPLQVETTPDGSLALVTSFDNAINFIDVASQSVVYTLQTTQDVVPSGIAIAADGTTAYVTSFGSPTFGRTPELLTIDWKQRAIVKTLPLPEFPQSVFLSPDGSQAWVTFPFSNQIAIVDTLSNTVSRTLNTALPFAVAFNSTGTRAFVSNGTTPGTVTVYDTSTYATVTSIPVGDEPCDLLVAPDDTTLYVNDVGAPGITSVDLTSLHAHTFTLPGPPLGLVLTQ